jgi:hypothetical protein
LICVFSDLGRLDFREPGFDWANFIYAAGLEIEHAPVGTSVLPFATILIEGEEFEQTRVVGEAAHGEGGLGYRADRFRSSGQGHGFLLLDLMGDGGSFHPPNAKLTPAADGHVFEGSGFDAGQGLELSVEFVEKRGEMTGGLVFNEHGFGDHATTRGIAGRDALALGSDGSTGFCAVGSGREFLEFGSHSRPEYRGGDGEFQGVERGSR